MDAAKIKMFLTKLREKAQGGLTYIFEKVKLWYKSGKKKNVLFFVGFSLLVSFLGYTLWQYQTEAPVQDKAVARQETSKDHDADRIQSALNRMQPMEFAPPETSIREKAVVKRKTQATARKAQPAEVLPDSTTAQDFTVMQEVPKNDATVQVPSPAPIWDEFYNLAVKPSF